MAMKTLILNQQGNEVKALHRSLQGLGFHVPAREREEARFGAGTRDAVLRFQAARSMPATGVADADTLANLECMAAAVPKEVLLEGRVRIADGSPAAGLELGLYRVDPAGEAKRVGILETDDQGYYSVRLQGLTDTAGLQVRAEGEKERSVALSEVLQGPARHRVLDLVLPRATAGAGRGEFSRLRDDLRKELGDRALADLQEGGERRDLSILHRRTGWDARLIALAAEAERRGPEVDVPPAVLYTLYRVGLPTEPDRLAVLGDDTLRQALERARESGLADFGDDGLERAVKALRESAEKRRLNLTAGAGVSSVGDLLQASGVSEEEGKVFRELYFKTAPTELWKQAEESGLGEAAVKRLRKTGKLAYLTRNNAPLVARLADELEDADDLADMVDLGLDRAEAWEGRLHGLAEGEAEGVAALLPPGRPGQKLEERLAAYTTEMARRVRLSYPARVLANQVDTGRLNLGVGKNLQRQVGRALKRVSRIDPAGDRPLGPLLRQEENVVLQGVPARQRRRVVDQALRVRRLYQVTPGDEALSAALGAKLDSAQQIAAFGEGDFVGSYGEALGEATALQVHRKSVQVHSLTRNLLTGVQSLVATPSVFGLSGPDAASGQAARQRVAERFPTLASLFGDLDFCACEHCASIFSPAAYLVDLLHDLDPPNDVWAAKMTDWRSRYDGTPYPFRSAEERQAFRDRWQELHPGVAVPDVERKPYDVLADRRPDLAHIPLTCENTHTALPHIDVANEIMEYAVVHGALEPAAARDTGDAESEDLLAEPRHLLADAYAPLRRAAYPIGLPFDLWQSQTRALLGHFEVEYAEALEAFRRRDALSSGGGRYGRASVFLASLGLPVPELERLTTEDPEDGWFRLYGFAGEAEAQDELTSAQTVARRLGVSYEDLAALLESRFVNPGLAAAPVLHRLDAGVADLFRLREHEAWADVPLPAEDRDWLVDGLEALGEAAKEAVEKVWDRGVLDGVLVLRPPADSCDFAATKVLRADGEAPSPYDWFRLHVLARLWRRLDLDGRLDLAELDVLLTSLVPGFEPAADGAVPAVERFGAALRTGLIHLAHLETVRGRLTSKGRVRESLLTLWAPLPTAGRDSLYGALFLNPATEEAGEVFDDPAGDVPAARRDALAEHLEAVQAALGLSADEVTAILAAHGEDVGDAMSLERLSRLYRHAVLADGLGVEVEELLSWISITRIDPFPSLAEAPLENLDDDHPFTGTLRFLELVQRLQAAGFTAAELDRRLRHRIDPLGEWASDQEEVEIFLTALAGDLAQLDRDLSLPPRAAEALADDEMWRRIGLVLPADAVETLRAMWEGRIEYRASAALADPAAALAADPFAGEAGIHLGRDPVREEVWLRYQGVLLPAERDRLAALADAEWRPLLDDVAAQARSFFDRYLLRTPLTAGADAGFLEAGDFEPLFSADTPVGERKRRLLAAFSPRALEVAIRQAVVQALAGRHERDEVEVESLLLAGDVLPAPGDGGPLLAAFRNLRLPGLTATYRNAAGNLVARRRVTGETIDQEPPAGAARVVFTGWVESAAGGSHRFEVRAPADGVVRLRVGDGPVLADQRVAAGDEVAAVAELSAGARQSFELAVEGLDGAGVEVRVRNAHSGLRSLDLLTLYPAADLERAARAAGLLGNLFAIADQLDLSARELEHVLTRWADFGPVSLAHLPTREGEVAPVRAAELLVSLEGVVLYTELRLAMAAGGEGLLDLLQAARVTRPVGSDPGAERSAVMQTLHDGLAELTRRDPVTVGEVVQHLGFEITSRADGDGVHVAATDFARLRSLDRLWRALHLVARLGIPAATALRAVVPEPDAASARALRDAVRARFDEATWRRVAPSIFDPLRRLRRDALVAHLLHRHRLSRVEELYEHFLLDPAMEPVVQTSRIQLAIASVQLFVQRGLLNLEPQVDPSVLDGERWSWMKRYRVWEAARKLAVFPENWLEPEFRDDKSHLYRALEGELLEGEVSEETVEQAFFGYLRGLDEIARLEVVSLHADEAVDGDTTLHVLGRTSRLPHRYYHRHHRHDAWSPWQPVPVEIEGDHVALVVWRRRLQVFWVTFRDLGVDMDAPTGSGLSETTASDATLGQIEAGAIARTEQRKVEVQLNWAEHLRDEWSVRESSGFGGTLETGVTADFDPAEVFVRVEKEVAGLGDGAIQIHLGTPIHAAFRVANRNAPPRRSGSWLPVLPPFDRGDIAASRVKGPASGELSLHFIESVRLEADEPPDMTMRESRLLGPGGDGGFTLVPCNNGPGILDPTGAGWGPALSAFFQALYGEPIPEDGNVLLWEAVGELSLYFSAATGRPFFYQNDEHVFFVQPTVSSTKVRDWGGWVLDPPVLVEPPVLLPDIPVEPLFPMPLPLPPLDLGPLVPADPGWLDVQPPDALFPLRPPEDWLGLGGSAIRVGGQVVGPAGGFEAVDFAAGGAGTAWGAARAAVAGRRFATGVGGGRRGPTGGGTPSGPWIIGPGGVGRGDLDRLRGLRDRVLGLNYPSDRSTDRSDDFGRDR